MAPMRYLHGSPRGAVVEDLPQHPSKVLLRAVAPQAYQRRQLCKPRSLQLRAHKVRVVRALAVVVPGHAIGLATVREQRVLRIMIAQIHSLVQTTSALEGRHFDGTNEYEVRACL